MGYYSYYTLDWECQQGCSMTESEIPYAVVSALHQINPYEFNDAPDDWSPEDIATFIKDSFDVNGMLFCDCMKWYESDDDMVRLSKQLPDILFILDRSGDDMKDIYRYFYLNGSSYAECCIVEPEFDARKLKADN